MSDLTKEDVMDLLKGEGETRTQVKTRFCCKECGEPATKRHTFLLPNARRNPASNGFGRDELVWCADGSDAFSCDEHERVTRVSGDEREWGTTHTLKPGRNDHMFLFWMPQL
jgi:hypothetical protein